MGEPVIYGLLAGNLLQKLKTYLKTKWLRVKKIASYDVPLQFMV